MEGTTANKHHMCICKRFTSCVLFFKEINNPLTKIQLSSCAGDLPPAAASSTFWFFVVCLKAAQLSVKPWVVVFFNAVFLQAC